MSPVDYGAFSGNILTRREQEDQGGLLASIIREVAKDVKGAAKVGAAISLAPFDALGAEVPIAFDDLGMRDWTGAAAVASMFVGGVAATGARSILAGQGLKALGRGAGAKAAQEASRAWATRAGALTNAALFAGTEASAGAFFGAVKPLESGEDRLEEILGDAAFFGAAGGGLSLLGSGFRATVGGRLAQMKGTTKAALLQDAAKRRETSTSLAEFAGLRLRNASTNESLSIHKLATGKVRVRKGTEIQDFGSFNEALSDSFSRGFNEHLGLSRSRLTSEALRADLPEEILTALNAADGDLSSVVDSLHFSNYRAVREALSKSSEISGLHAWLGAETLVPSPDALTPVSLHPSFKKDVLAVLPKDISRALSKVEDPAEFLRQAALHGAVDVDNLLTGSEMAKFVDELFINDLVPEASTFSAHTPYDATFLAKFGTAQTIGKMHPEVMPLVDLGDAAAQAQTLGMRDAKQFLMDLEDAVSPKAAARGVEIIEASAEAGGVAASRQAAIQAAQATGDAQVIDFVTRTSEKLNHTRLRLVAAGRLGDSEAERPLVDSARKALSDALDQGGTSEEVEALARQLDPSGVVSDLIEDAGLAGYFPIVHTGSVRVDIHGVAEPNFFGSFNEARRFLTKDGRGGFISEAFSTDPTISKGVSGREFGRLIKTIREASTVEISSREAAEALMEGGTFPTSGPRKFSRHLQRRRLGTRDFAESPLRALDLYLGNAERTLAFNNFEREANRVIENIPAFKSGARKWAEDQRDLLLGRPTTAEKMVADVFRNIAPGEVSTFALRKYSGMLRWGQGLFKLGGVWSGLVNSTQFAVNSVPILGTRWAAEGMHAYFNPVVRKRVEKLIAQHKVDLGLHVSLTREGELVGGETVSREIRSAIARAKLGNVKGGTKAAYKALENIWMVVFNKAERMNRLGTFWGAYRKGLAENMTEETAVAYARDLTLKTQFDYSVANIPQALQGPVGSVLGQFKTFFINEVELIASLDNATRLKMMVAFQALGGAGAILAVPGVDLVDNASRYFFDVKASEAIKLEGGKEDAGGLAKFAAFGLPGFANLDMTNYIGPGGFDQLTMGLLGPTVSDLAAFKTFFGSALRDVKNTGYVQPPTIHEWMQRVMPAQIRRITRGHAIYRTGEVRNPYSGKLIYRPDDRLRSAGLAALGGQTVTSSMDRIQNDIIRRETESHNSSRESYRRQIGLASLQGDALEVQRLLAQASGAGFIFDASDVASARKAFAMSAGERREARTPRALRTEFEDFFNLPSR